MKRFKSVFVICLTMVLLAGTASAGNITVRNWMNETDLTTKKFYAQGVEEGVISGWLASARTNGVSQEQIDECMASIDKVNGNFKTYKQAVDSIVAYHLDNGGKSKALLSLVVANAYLNTKACKGE
jgi:hypothetical protein